MRQKKFLICTICLKISLLFLTVSFVLFPRFFWKTNTDMPDVQKAIRNRKSLEQPNDKGVTPLIGAASQGQIKMVNLLLDNGANINAHAQNYDDVIIEAGNTALHYACLNGHHKLVKLLVQRGANVLSVNDNRNSSLYTIINSVDSTLDMKEKAMDALFENKPHQIRQLINMQNMQGYTPLMRAAELRNYGLVKMLIEKWKPYINFDLKRNDEKTTLGVAIKESADDSIIQLIKKAQER